MKLLDTLLPTDDTKRKWSSIGITVSIAGALSLWGIYAIGEYGIALFILTPLFMGFGSAVLMGYKKQISKRQAKNVGFLTLGFFTVGLLLFAIEGIICIAMAAPFGILLTYAGSILGYSVVAKAAGVANKMMFVLIGIIPATAFFEKQTQPELTSVITAVEINASPERVWKNVIEFPRLKAPTEFIFKAGIAYPVNAEIEGSGVGAIRHCNFTTGSFVEPVTVWDAPKLLKFDVVQQPAPMKEISFWDIDAPHLHDYFVSKKGQFKLIALPGGRTRLEGTTWYYHNIKPAIYWRLWSNYIIHKIHERVLLHIKVNAETSKPVV